MGQHRKTKHYRRIFITAAAVGAVGVPSVALACSEWPSGTGAQPQAAVTGTPMAWGQVAYGDHSRNGLDAVAGQTARPATPWSTAPAAPAPPATTPSTEPGAKKRLPVQRSQQAHRVPGPRHTAAPATPPATPTAAAPSTPTTAAPATTAAATTAPATAASPSVPPAAPSAPQSAAPSTGQPAATASAAAADILRLVNAERSGAGCRPLTLNSTLSKAAQAHSEDMAAHRNMSHTGSDGSSPGDRITRAGYTWSSYGENVAYGYTTAEQVMAGWMASPGHRANILDCGFTELGVGLAQPGGYWTQDFGTAR
ncbi:CAP domain-containing protein [Streptomyces sp. NPDC017095]|uniref:CAP domain-containing protein n=1 Tax=Streptomyces sp. NPDC017095 TaxID=3364977 RepID=UPI0037A56EDA